MTGKTLFEVLVRVVGIWEFASGVKYLPQLLLTLPEILGVSADPSYRGAAFMFSTSLVAIVIGIVLFLAARPLANRIYPVSDRVAHAD